MSTSNKDEFEEESTDSPKVNSTISNDVKTVSDVLNFNEVDLPASIPLDDELYSLEPDFRLG